jgi:hypothetical protein
MCFHRLQDREAQTQFRIYWRPGKNNLADYFTKHHSPAHHISVRTQFLTRVKDLAEERRQQQEQRHTQITKS